MVDAAAVKKHLTDMYKFVRIHKKNSADYGDWFFKPESLDDINEHWKTYCGAEIKKTIHERVQHVFKYGRAGHPTTQFGMGVEAFCTATNLDFAEGCVNIEQEALRNRIRDFENGREIYLNEGMTVYMLDDRFFEVVETVEVENLEFPTKKNWTMDDVRYMQWNMLGNTGDHWYAKLGKRDIYDEEGHMKWDTKSEAEKAAKWFIDNKTNNK